MTPLMLVIHLIWRIPVCIGIVWVAYHLVSLGWSGVIAGHILLSSAVVSLAWFVVQSCERCRKSGSRLA